MKKKSFNIFCTLVLTSCLVFQVGCASFSPPHANSFYTKDETVTVKMLEWTGNMENYEKEWKQFRKQIPTLRIPGPSPPPTALPAIVPLAIGVIAPLAFDYAKAQLKQEAENYVQQFGTTYFGAFWKKEERQDQYTQKYYGFEIVRKAKRFNDKSSEAEDVFKIVYGFASDVDGVFWATPFYFVTNKIKAKVVSWPKIVSWLFGKTHKIDTKVELALDAVWTERDKYCKQNIAKFDPLIIKGYDIDKPKELRASCKDDAPCRPPLEGGLNSFPRIPTGSSSREAGKFWLTVLVTESDTAKTKKYISDLSDLLEKNRDKVIEYIRTQTQPQTQTH